MLIIDASPPQRWTPALSNSAIWIKANSSNSLTLSGSNVTSVRDLANNLNFSVTGAITINTTELGSGRSVLRIDNTSSSQFLSAIFNYAGNAITLASVHRNNSSLTNAPNGVAPTRYGRLWSLSSTTQPDFDNTNGIILTYGINSNNGIYLFRNNSIAAQTSPLINNQWASVVATRNSSQARIILNGGSASSGSTSSANLDFSRIRIGNDIAALDSGMNGFIAENILWTRELSTDEINLLSGYFHWEWGLQSLLPANHPFRNRKPTVSDA